MTTRTNGSSLMNRELAEKRAQILKALGNPSRLRIMACLGDRGEATVGALAEALGLPQSSISRQLSWLRLAELVSVRKEGGFHHYSIAMPQLLTLLGCLEQCERGSRGSTTRGMATDGETQ